MPHFRLLTNIPQSKIPVDLPGKLCEVVSKSLGKPLDVCVATVIGGVMMSWGGENIPAAQASLMSIGALGVEINKKCSKAIGEVVSKELGIPIDKMYIQFMDCSSSDIGCHGTTFHEIFGK